MLFRAARGRVAACRHTARQHLCTRSLQVSAFSLDEVRVRFAPSPTGYLHLGGLRTALYNFLFAKSNNGKFILRIEDTDQSRLVPQASTKLEEMLLWAKIPPDESPQVGGPVGPYMQSQRLHIYQEYVKRLLENGTAYKCFCSNRRLNWLRNDAMRRNEVPRYDNRCRHLSPANIEELEANQTESCIRFKLEAMEEPFEDIIYGSVLNSGVDQEGDPVIMKTDGYPTYHFANVVDDHLMGITHVLRGVEWQVSTPKHLQLYKAFGWSPPVIGHLPLILNTDGTKLSKRQGDVHIEHYRASGYFPEAVLNFVTDIGGGFEGRDSRLLLPVEELIKKFRVSRITKNSCRLDKEKLYQYNQVNLHRCLEDPTELKVILSQLKDLLRKTYGEKLSTSMTQEKVLGTDYLMQVLEWSKERITCLQDLVHPAFSYVWVVPDQLPVAELPAMACSHVDVLQRVAGLIVADLDADSFTKENIVKLVKSVGKEYKLKTPVIMKLMRMSVSGLTEGPPVGEMLAVLGRDAALERIRHAAHLIASSDT
ncbi:probable glutamate--tRNA ligase, mitochondrial [Eriocheir sinensis]|uniref:probable glutamate--tRNA ligase, mitochondrial n=1 Tax=Eriocheir sinensis TaxID=95602 RepID=UPI0021CA95FC|nr:probable glutamate--tRNA ligase, mitochondrial [Eriocheir sinensis]XP_050691447.1 probable glutamate--tRNA ligase, mitochondrial [Eriocheir sinensis]XP_050691448.1 probable glutamate--tRNA ligase, mitochondrial [Eriocheir sinensis]XP_050691449.1 probable glutamate--tRNA ligase, mitochondrial [Eriocheir sinensis]